MTVRPDIKREVNGEILKERAHIIQFSDGFYETSDPKEIAHVKKNVEYGVHIHEVESNDNTTPTPQEEKIIETAKVRGRPKKIT